MTAERKSLELAWAAGLFEGEGCISVNVDKRISTHTGTVLLSMKMTDEDVVRRFHEVVEVGSFRVHNTPSMKSQDRKVQYMWQCAGAKAEELAWTLSPWWGIRRRTRFIECLQEVRQRRDRTA